MEVIEVPYWADFSSHLATHYWKGGYIFRGVTDKGHELVPKVGRKDSRVTGYSLSAEKDSLV